MAKSISMMMIILAFTVANLLLPAACSASSRGGESDDFNDRASKTGVSAIKRPFFVGSRYGRSEYFGNQKQLSVAPRNDRFFLQSRYGKRSMEQTTNDFSEQLDRQEEDVPLVCLHTGVADLYRCRNRSFDDMKTDE